MHQCHPCFQDLIIVIVNIENLLWNANEKHDGGQFKPAKKIYFFKIACNFLKEMLSNITATVDAVRDKIL